jgi:hypothetical protein
MTRPSAVPASPAFDGIARGAQVRDRIAIVVQAPPAAIFRALHEVDLRDMKLGARGASRSALPTVRAHAGGRFDAAVHVIARRERHARSRDHSHHELITGSAAQLHGSTKSERHC